MKLLAEFKSVFCLLVGWLFFNLIRRVQFGSARNTYSLDFTNGNCSTKVASWSHVLSIHLLPASHICAWI